MPANNQIANLAKAILKDKGRGVHVSNQLAASCRRVIQGGGSSFDIKSVRDYYGVSKSGASGIRSFQSGVTGAYNQAQAVNLAMSSSGPMAGIAQAQLAQSLTGKLSKAVKSKMGKELAESVAESIGSSPTAARKLVYAVARGLRLAGAIASAGIVGAQIGMAYLTSQDSATRSRGNLADLSRNYQGDPRLVRDIERKNRGLVRGSNFFGDAFGFLEGDNEAENERRTRANVDARERASGAVEYMGGDANAALERKAREVGVPVSQLTPGEKKEALDEEVGNQDEMLRQEARNYAKTQLALQSPWDRFLDSVGKSGRVMDKTKLLEQEFIDRARKTSAQSKQGAGVNAAKIVAAIRREKSPDERQKEYVTTEIARMEQNGINSRRQMRWDE